MKVWPQPSTCPVWPRFAPLTNHDSNKKRHEITEPDIRKSPLNAGIQAAAPHLPLTNHRGAENMPRALEQLDQPPLARDPQSLHPELQSLRLESPAMRASQLLCANGMYMFIYIYVYVCIYVYIVIYTHICTHTKCNVYGGFLRCRYLTITIGFSIFQY